MRPEGRERYSLARSKPVVRGREGLENLTRTGIREPYLARR